jgi:hypothetical protein
MRRAFALAVVIAAVGCAPATKREDAMNSKPQPNPGCHDAIVAFAEMKLDRWRGLPACTHDDLAAALGPGGPDWNDGFGRAHIYPGRAATPYGITVHFRGDRAAFAIASGEALAAASIEAMLGPPEARAPSRLFEPQNEQWIYASRGLALHVAVVSHAPLRVYGYEPTSVEQFQQSDLFYVRAWEERR